jgi:hypothetical protein
MLPADAGTAMAATKTRAIGIACLTWVLKRGILLVFCSGLGYPTRYSMLRYQP